MDSEGVISPGILQDFLTSVQTIDGLNVVPVGQRNGRTGEVCEHA